MSSQWREVAISEVCELIVDCVNKTAPKVDFETPYKMIRTTNVRNGKIDEEDVKYVEKEVFEKWTRRAKVLPGDVILTREAPIGEVGSIRSKANIFLGQRLMQYRANPKILDSKFLLYAFLSPNLQHQFNMHEGTGSVVSHIRVPDCYKFRLMLPGLDQQRRIGNVLGAIDEKIELNRHLNQTLEAMAQAMFKSWFVDFDPVIDNALAAGNPIPEPFAERAERRRAYLTASSDSSQPHRNTLNPELRALFPSSFVETEELGWIPEGWGIDTFADLTKQIRLNVNAEHIDSEEIYVGLEHIDKKHIFLNQCGVGSDVSSNKSRFEKGDLLFGKLRPYFHKVVVAPDKGISSTDILVFRAKKTYYHSYMLMVAFSDKFVEYAHAGSTGTRMPRASAKDLLSFAVALPNQNLLTVFESQLVNYWESGIARVNENTVLKDIRDTLLPKLLSGQLRIPDASVLVAEALA